MRFAALLLLAFTSCAAADTRAALDAALASLTGHEPVRARVELRVENTSGDPKKPETSASDAAASVEVTAEGLRIFWDSTQLQALSAEKQGGGALDELSASRLTHYLNAAPQLIEGLKNAELTGSSSAEWQGKPAQVLTFQLKPELSEKDRKYIKELDARATVWLGDDGLPLAAERHIKVRGRAMLVISFESAETEKFEYARRGDRLVVTRHEHERHGSGAGESSQQKTVAHLTLDPLVSG